MDDAINLILAGKWREAAEVDRARLRRSPNDLHAWLRLANASLQLGDEAEARAAWTRALALDPNNDIARKYLGLAESFPRPTIEERHRRFLAARGLPDAELVRTTNQHRVTHCYNCKSHLDNDIDLECRRCEWILCDCGACGCGYHGWY